MKQKVHVGFTESGIRGLFTGHYLVMHLNDEQDAEALATRCGFEFETEQDQPKEIKPS